MNWRAIMRGESTELYEQNPQNPQNTQNTANKLNIAHFANIAGREKHWNPELASEGYVWCMNCQYFNGVNCDHAENIFRTVNKCPQVPRMCHWYSAADAAN